MTEYTGNIVGLTPDEQVNTIMFRLAQELGYESIDGVISADLDDVLNSALKTIHIHNNEFYYPDMKENN